MMEPSSGASSFALLLESVTSCSKFATPGRLVGELVGRRGQRSLEAVDVGNALQDVRLAESTGAMGAVDQRSRFSKSS